MTNFTLLMDAGAVIVALALWLILLLAIADDLWRLAQARHSGPRVFCTTKAGMIAGPFVVAAGFALTLLLRSSHPDPGNSPPPYAQGTKHDEAGVTASSDPNTLTIRKHASAIFERRD